MSLVQIIENNFFAIGRYWGNINSSMCGDNEIYSMNTGIEVADLNWTWNEKPLVENDTKIIRQLKKNYNDLNLPFWVWVYPCGQSEKTREILLDEGFNHREAIPCMALDLDSMPFDIQKNGAVEISFVKDETELKIWEAVSFAGFEMPLEARRQYHEFVKAFNIRENSPQKLLLAYWKGEPVGTILLFLQSNTIGIYFVSTLSEYRNRGIALALIINTIRFAKSSGYKYCVLQSSKEGLNVYLRAGFKEYCRTDVYCLPD